MYNLHYCKKEIITIVVASLHVRLLNLISNIFACLYIFSKCVSIRSGVLMTDDIVKP